LTVVVEATVLLVTVNVALVCPAGTVTLAGTVAAEVFELVSVTTAPPAGADAPSVTMPVLVLVAVTVAGLSVTDCTTSDPEVGVAASCRSIVTPLHIAAIVVRVNTVTLGVVMVKVPVVELAGTITLEGTVAAAELLLVRLIVAPPYGAGLSIVTVPVTDVPPTTLDDDRPNVVSDTGGAGSTSKYEALFPGPLTTT